MSDTVSGLANALEAVPRTPFNKRERNSPSLIRDDIFHKSYAGKW